jgi:hypothetical protein
VSIRFFGNGCYWFRAYSGLIGKAPDQKHGGLQAGLISNTHVSPVGAGLPAKHVNDDAF